MAILLLSGSARRDSSNQQLLYAIEREFPDDQFAHFDGLPALPLFLPDADHAPWPVEVLRWRAAVEQAEAVIVSTPEYLHNLPALLKNALEWITSSGELIGKPVLAITYTPHEPRGEQARQSLLWSLGALDARVVAELPLYQSEMNQENGLLLFSSDAKEMISEGLKLLGT